MLFFIIHIIWLSLKPNNNRRFFAGVSNFHSTAHGATVVRSIPHGGPIALFLVPASAPQLV